MNGSIKGLVAAVLVSALALSPHAVAQPAVQEASPPIPHDTAHAVPDALPDALLEAYRSALAVTPSPRALEATWRSWLLDIAETPPEGRDDLYAFMLEELERFEARDVRLRALRIDTADLESGCVDVWLEDCQWRNTRIALASGVVLHVQHQGGFSEHDGVGAAFVVLAQRDAGLAPIAWGAGAASYEPPVSFSIGNQPYIAVPGRHGGTGAFNADHLWAVMPGYDLRDIDIWSWQARAAEHLPAGLEIWKGVEFDWPGLSARTSLWRESDANCCPTGGEAHLLFAIDDDTLLLREVRVLP
ncbi:MAG: hypothetical protein ACK4E3_07030 [Brevundimonas sp.]|jgi:hypothetical protein|uniref:hypothetical protein n=1 Tax=Brevundimonas sp. TaxID=1871086 RepID=UPI00391A3037